MISPAAITDRGRMLGLSHASSLVGMPSNG
jgi:hypothetical protein